MLLLRSTRSHQTGKYYFELIVDESRADKIVSSVIARVSDSTRWTGVGHEIKARDLVLHLGPSDLIVVQLWAATWAISVFQRLQ